VYVNTQEHVAARSGATALERMIVMADALAAIAEDRGSPTRDDHEPAAGKQKLSLNLTDEAAQTVREMAASKGISVTEVIRRGISLERFVMSQLEANGTFLIRRSDGAIETVHFVF
jgi:hypothetical protein